MTDEAPGRAVSRAVTALPDGVDSLKRGMHCHRPERVARFAFCGFLIAAGHATAQQVPPTEARSLLGKDLAGPVLSTAFEAEQRAALAALEQRLATAPGDLEATIWRGRRLGYLGRYREAVDVFTAALENHPDDARLLRHRGHRYLTLRRIDDAAADLERGLALVAGRPDQVEADGLPNLFNQATSTLKTNLWYHLGLARYLQGDFGRAAEAYRSALALADNPDMAVAAAYWLRLALRRTGRAAEAAGPLAAVPLDGDLLESHDYRQLLNLLAGRVTEAELLGAHPADTLGSATLGYGIGAWHLLEGRPERARAQFEKVAANPGWAAFGVLAAEAELARWPQASVPLDITSPKPAKFGGFIKYETLVTLNGKANRLVATVYDPISGKIATAEASLVLP